MKITTATIRSLAPRATAETVAAIVDHAGVVRPSLALRLATGIFAAGIVLAMWVRAGAEWQPQYAQASPEVREWYRSRELTPEAQKRFAFKSCCDHADVVKTRFRVSGSGNDSWFWLDAKGEWQQVPPDIIHWNDPTPTGEPVLFAVGGIPVCFFAPQSGN